MALYNIYDVAPGRFRGLIGTAFCMLGIAAAAAAGRSLAPPKGASVDGSAAAPPLAL